MAIVSFYESAERQESRVLQSRRFFHCSADRLMNFSSGREMQSSCLVKYTTRSLYIRTLVYIRYRRGSSSTDPRAMLRYGAIPAGHTQRGSFITSRSHERSEYLSSPWDRVRERGDFVCKRSRLPQKSAAAKLNLPQRRTRHFSP